MIPVSVKSSSFHKSLRPSRLQQQLLSAHVYVCIYIYIYYICIIYIYIYTHTTYMYVYIYIYKFPELVLFKLVLPRVLSS